MKIFTVIGLFAAMFYSISVQAQHHHHAGVEAPIGVMGDHEHKEGEFMLSYRHSVMTMKGNRSGTSDVSPAEVLAGFSVVPLRMKMEMHMLGAMYGVNNKLTAMAMIPYIRKTMDHRTGGGVEFETEAKGFGDTKLNGLYTVYRHGYHRVHLSGGVSLPTGSITKRDQTPASDSAKMPYPMQLGSGTVDPLLGVTYIGGDGGSWGWGVQASATPRFGKNNEGYRLGDEYGATSWVARQFNHYASGSLRLDGKVWGNISGRDRDLNVGMVPTARTDLRGGERIDALIGVNLKIPEADGYSFAIEAGMPAYQRLDGPQLQADKRIIFGIRKTF